MTLGDMREQGVQHLIAYCLNDSCRHQALIDVSSYAGDTLVSWFRSKVKCAKCGGKRVDVRPNWKEKPGMPTNAAVMPRWWPDVDHGCYAAHVRGKLRPRWVKPAHRH
jgi:hypothetical protein